MLGLLNQGVKLLMPLPLLLIQLAPGTGPCFRSTGSIGIGSFSHAATYALVLMLLKLVLMDLLLSSFPY